MERWITGGWLSLLRRFHFTELVAHTQMPVSQCSRTAAAALCHERTSYSKLAVLGLGLLVILVLSSWFQTFASVSTTQTMGTATTTKCNIVPEHHNHKNKNHHDDNDNGDVFALASKQSLGFFDDISEAQWKVSQQIHFKSFPNHYAERVSKTSPKPNEWYAEHFQEEFHCAGARRLPSNSMNDGPKWVCDPHRISQQTDCLVYSFGCFGNIVFEKAVKEEIGSHCEIHTFDIVAQRAGMNYSSLLEAINVTFHHWGIGTPEQAEESARNPDRPPMHTLEQTMEMLNHTGRTIDIFKIDCEGCEWIVYPQLLQSPSLLRQILVEVSWSMVVPS